MITAKDMRKLTIENIKLYEIENLIIKKAQEGKSCLNINSSMFSNTKISKILKDNGFYVTIGNSVKIEW